MKQIKTHLRYKISHDIIPCIPRISLRHWPRTDMDDSLSLVIVQKLKLMSELAKDNGQKLTLMTLA